MDEQGATAACGLSFQGVPNTPTGFQNQEAKRHESPRHHPGHIETEEIECQNSARSSHLKPMSSSSDSTPCSLAGRVVFSIFHPDEKHQLKVFLLHLHKSLCATRCCSPLSSLVFFRNSPRTGTILGKLIILKLVITFLQGEAELSAEQPNP